MEITKTNTIAEVVAENYKASDVFKKNGIDFCCGGDRTISEACQTKNLSFSDIAKELMEIDSEVLDSEDFGNWGLDVLIDYIVSKHHKYVRDNIPVIIEHSDKVARVHGQNHPETVEINKLFHAVSEELTAHMFKEEEILFPYIMTMVGKSTGQSIESLPCFPTVKAPIAMMMTEHDLAGKILKTIDEHSNNYTPPVDACATYNVLYAKLQDFESDLHKHIHLENNILFPKSIDLEKITTN